MLLNCFDSHAGKKYNENDNDCCGDDSSCGSDVLAAPVVPKKVAVGEEINGSEEFSCTRANSRHILLLLMNCAISKFVSN